jgi:hypothetical protein
LIDGDTAISLLWGCMGTATSQTIGKYYDLYKGIDVTFTKEVIQATGLIPQQVYIKCMGETWPCVVYATSFQGAKIIINSKTGLYDKVQRANNLVALRFSFRESDKNDPLSFSVSARASGYSAYGGSSDVSMLTVQYSQRPPDDLIEIMGRLLDANINSAKRREERIIINPDIERKLKIVAKETVIIIEGVPRRCILRDISFSGGKVIMVGISKFLVNREFVLRLDFEDPREQIMVKGRSIRSEEVAGRKELLALGLVFDEKSIPMTYKMRINDFLSQTRADSRVGNQEAAETTEKS